MAELVYNVTEAAEALGISRRSMYELMNREDFPAALKIGGRRLISRELLAEWVRQQAGGQKNTAPSVTSTGSGKVECVLNSVNSTFTITEKRR